MSSQLVTPSLTLCPFGLAVNVAGVIPTGNHSRKESKGGLITLGGMPREQTKVHGSKPATTYTTGGRSR